jgi:hypothetical protein
MRITVATAVVILQRAVAITVVIVAKTVFEGGLKPRQGL